MNILIVEDNDQDRRCLRALLHQEGHKVAQASNGNEALMELQKTSTDLILLDMLMPGVDGWEFLEIRQTNRAIQSIPVLVTTGLSIATDHWATELGANGLLRKPLEIEQLLIRIDALAGSAHG